mmetsp:Transcript_16511/g.35996  ORF Transcript_16511/g.35996 Transcript_16511/m.35996 type:complete len:263 (+) Transcript_16511:84-872(+)
MNARRSSLGSVRQRRRRRRRRIGGAIARAFLARRHNSQQRRANVVDRSVGSSSSTRQSIAEDAVVVESQLLFQCFHGLPIGPIHAQAFQGVRECSKGHVGRAVQAAQLVVANDPLDLAIDQLEDSLAVVVTGAQQRHELAHKRHRRRRIDAPPQGLQHRQFRRLDVGLRVFSPRELRHGGRIQRPCLLDLGHQVQARHDHQLVVVAVRQRCWFQGHEPIDAGHDGRGHSQIVAAEFAEADAPLGHDGPARGVYRNSSGCCCC